MQSIRRCCNISPVVSLFCLTVLSLGSQALAQPVSGEVCKPISDRTGDLGCWIIAHEPIGQLNQSQVFWHLDVYPTREAAEAAKGPQGTVVDSLGKTWLLTIAEEGWRPIGGERVAEIGPLPITAGEKYSALEAIFTPGMTSRAHTHSGPEAWYGAVASCVGIRCDAISGISRIPGQAARSIGGSIGFVARVCQPSTLRMLI